MFKRMKSIHNIVKRIVDKVINTEDQTIEIEVDDEATETFITCYIKWKHRKVTGTRMLGDEEQVYISEPDVSVDVKTYLKGTDKEEFPLYNFLAIEQEVEKRLG